MGADFDPDEAMARAVADGRPAAAQMDRLRQAAYRCYTWAEKVQGLIPYERAWEACRALDQQLDFVSQNAGQINQKIFGDELPSGSYVPGQLSSDYVYGKTYLQYLLKDAGGNQAAVEAAYEALLNDIQTNGMTPSKHARLDAIADVMSGRPYDPPVLDRDDPSLDSSMPPPDPDPDDPSLDSSMSTMAVASAPARQTPHPARGQKKDLMPVIDYWLVDAATMHFAPTCPACPAGQARVMQLDAPEHPVALGQRLGVHACGTCLRIFTSDSVKGFLLEIAWAGRTLHLYRGHIEYEKAGFFGGSMVKMRVGDIHEVYIARFRKIVILSTAQGKIRVPLRRTAQIELVREAFERMGVAVR